MTDTKKARYNERKQCESKKSMMTGLVNKADESSLFGDIRPSTDKAFLKKKNLLITYKGT